MSRLSADRHGVFGLFPARGGVGQNGQVPAQRPVLAVIALLGAMAAAGCGGGGHARTATSNDPAVTRARTQVDRAVTSVSPYRGPVRGPPAQPPRLVVFVAADPTNGGTAGVARGVQEAARAIGWPFRILDGEASVDGRRRALRTALALRPGGIILGGFDAAEQRSALRSARARGIPVVGWHAARRPGPDPALGLFTNVTTDPAVVAHFAASYAIADSNGTAAVVIFTDSEFTIATDKADVMRADIERCRRCKVLEVVDTPIADAQIRTPAVMASLLQRFGKRFGYLLTINGAYIGGARAALIGAGRRADQAPFSIAAGDGDASEFARIRAGDYQSASVAEPLNLQGWQLIDELNRARAGMAASGYVAPPRLITHAHVPAGAVFDPPSGYRANYRQIWGR
jgi:ribose transport system substrate-binding protein